MPAASMALHDTIRYPPMKYTEIFLLTDRISSLPRRLRSIQAARTASSKAGADLLVLAYHRTYGLPVTISRCSNNYGPYHFPEKLIPLMIANALAKRQTAPGVRRGLKRPRLALCRRSLRAIDLIIHKGRVGEVYNVGGHNEMKNIDIVKLILRSGQTGKPDHIRRGPPRPRHALRYRPDQDP